MNKKHLKIGLILFFSLFIFLFIVQFIDQAINGEMYAKIKQFIKTQNYIGNKGNGKVCSNKCIYIMKNTLAKFVDTSEVQIAPEFKKNLIYDDAIKSCKLGLQDYSELKVPTDISQKKIILLNQGVIYRKQLIQLYIDDLESIKNCHGDKSCLMENIRSFSNPESAKLSLKIPLNQIEVLKKYSIKSILLGGIAEAYIKYNIKKIEIK